MSGGQVSPLFSVLISCPGSTNGRRDARKPSTYIIPTLSPVEKNVCFNIFLRKLCRNHQIGLCFMESSLREPGRKQFQTVSGRRRSHCMISDGRGQWFPGFECSCPLMDKEVRIIPTDPCQNKENLQSLLLIFYSFKEYLLIRSAYSFLLVGLSNCSTQAQLP